MENRLQFLKWQQREKVCAVRTALHIQSCQLLCLQQQDDPIIDLVSMFHLSSRPSILKTSQWWWVNEGNFKKKTQKPKTLSFLRQQVIQGTYVCSTLLLLMHLWRRVSVTLFSRHPWTLVFVGVTSKDHWVRRDTQNSMKTLWCRLL